MQAALNKVSIMMLEVHLGTCILAAVQGEDLAERERVLGDVAGVTRVEADQRTRRVTVVWEEPATWEKIQSLLQGINYPPEGLIQLTLS